MTFVAIRQPDTGSSDIEREAAPAAAASIALVPFANVSSDPAHEFFVDGLSDELLNMLAKIRGIRVPGRSSCFYYKGHSAPVSEIARELNVKYVLEGSVRRNGDSLRITAQLTDAVTGFQIWSQTYDRTLADVFDVQRDIAHEVSRQLPGLIGVALAEPWEDEVDPQAHAHYLIGLGHLHGRVAGIGWAEAHAAFQEAVRIDPDYPLANAYLAVTLSIEQTPHAKELAREALAVAAGIAPDNADVLFAQGFVEMSFSRGAASKIEQAKAFFERAIAIDPSHSEARHARIRLIEDPLEKEPAFRDLIAADPLFFNARVNYAALLGDLGRWEEADAEFTRLRAMRPDFGRTGQITLFRSAGITHLLGKYAFENSELVASTSDDQFYVAGLLADFGALTEAKWLYSRPDMNGFFFLPRQQEVFLKWVDNDFSGARDLMGEPGNPVVGTNGLFAAIVSILARDADAAISFLDLFDSEIPNWDSQMVSSMYGMSGEMSIRVYAMALSMKGETARANEMFDRLIEVYNRIPEDLRATQGSYIMHAVDYAWRGETERALEQVRKARNVGWRYPRTYFADFSPWPDIDGPSGLLSPLRDNPEFQNIMAEIRNENTVLLADWEASYGALSNIRRQMGADASQNN